MNFDLQSMIGTIGGVAWGTVIMLTIMSVYSIGVMIERQYAYSKSRKQSRRFVPAVSRLLREGKIEEAIATSRDAEVRNSHLAKVVVAGLQEWRHQHERCEGDVNTEAAVDAVRRAIQRATAVNLAEIERGLGALATIGSTAPFVGLFGTTFGIIDAFEGMAVTGAGGIGAVSAGISEALVTTAYGLFVAVPAVWAYNYFSGHVKGFNVEMENSSSELLDYFIQHT